MHGACVRAFCVLTSATQVICLDISFIKAAVFYTLTGFVNVQVNFDIPNITWFKLFHYSFAQSLLPYFNYRAGSDAHECIHFTLHYPNVRFTFLKDNTITKILILDGGVNYIPGVLYVHDVGGNGSGMIANFSVHPTTGSVERLYILDSPVVQTWHLI